MNAPAAPLHRPRLPFYATAGAVLLLDQLTKLWFEKHYILGESHAIIPGILNFTLVHNDGMAFGLFQGNNFALGAVVLLIMAGAVWFARQFDWRPSGINVVGGLILAGAVGNLADRIRLGAVIDFIDVNLGFTRWPAFNVADSAITVAVAAILIATVLGKGGAVDPAGGTK
jgi:signal peptidase II